MAAEITFLHRKNRKRFKKLPEMYAQYRSNTVKNHGGGEYPLRVFRRELKRVLRRTDECVWSQNPRCFAVLHEGETVLGFADLRTVSQDLIETDYAYGTVEDFCIAENERGKGYGKLLYARVEKVFRTNGTKTVLLTPDPKTGAAFWKKMGYLDTGKTVELTDSRIFKKELT